MKQILFYATRRDIHLLLATVEREISLHYARTGIATSPNLTPLSRVADLPDLGQATAASAVACSSFLVSPRTVAFKVRRIIKSGFADCFAVDQLENPETVEFAPGGMWGEDVLLNGRIATASESETSQTLMKRFHTAIKQQFGKVKAFYVGPDARQLLNAGKRLTIAAQSSREFDLVLQ